jgi:hypothetical protein
MTLTPRLTLSISRRLRDDSEMNAPNICFIYFSRARRRRVSFSNLCARVEQKQ